MCRIGLVEPVECCKLTEPVFCQPLWLLLGFQINVETLVLKNKRQIICDVSV